MRRYTNTITKANVFICSARCFAKNRVHHKQSESLNLHCFGWALNTWSAAPLVSCDLFTFYQNNCVCGTHAFFSINTGKNINKLLNLKLSRTHICDKFAYAVCARVFAFKIYFPW